jgi:hypothetical protein
MMAIEFPGYNTLLTRPTNMTDEECSSIVAYRGIDADSHPFILTVWQPSKEDIEAINAGRPICMKTFGQGFLPTELYTYDENYKANV